MLEQARRLPMLDGLAAQVGRAFIARVEFFTQGGTSMELVGLVYSCRRAMRGVVSAELDFNAELVGLVCSRRRAMRGVASAELDFEYRAGRAYMLT
ncbi:hypothetical protein F511_22437 [Dorcoceras hygrometricum]|uniref:Uncharacterized protein n=1 Tax=Dorcoceras hygrometricum TaxID=472368 RepID=A0A2Z7AZU4_9LAMI|nr:hypothetical protein F511_22437 [Dorcoceras hygrometricum]